MKASEMPLFLFSWWFTSSLMPVCSTSDLFKVIHTKWVFILPSGMNHLGAIPYFRRYILVLQGFSNAHGVSLCMSFFFSLLLSRAIFFPKSFHTSALTLHLILGQDFNLLSDLFPATFFWKAWARLCWQDFNFRHRASANKRSPSQFLKLILAIKVSEFLMPWKWKLFTGIR